MCRSEFILDERALSEDEPTCTQCRIGEIHELHTSQPQHGGK